MLSVLPDAVTTNAATPVIINVLANDSGAGLTITSFSNPANGSLVFNGDKTFTYTPMAGFIGDDSFVYTVRDAQGTPANAEVTISVIPNTGATVATDDVVEVIAGASVIIPVLANDMAAGGGTLQIIAVSMPGHGAINVLPDQTIRYVPQAGFTGIDSFTYTVVDGQGATATATVTIKVLIKNSPPLAVDDTFTIEAGQPTVLAVLANDSDPDGGPLQVVGFTMPSHGGLVFNPDRTFTYTPAAGYLGPDQFTYTIRDNRGASAVASVTMSIVEVSETPVAFDDQVTTEAGVPVVIDVLANDLLPDGQQISLIAVTLPFRGRLTFNPDKTITYTPNPGFVGTDDFSYTIRGEGGETSRAKVMVEVTPATVTNTYDNGYGYRRRIVLPAPTAGQTTINDAVVLFAEEAGWLRTVANGGKVVSAEAADLRFELGDGTKLDHEIERYDPVGGKVLAWVRLPSWTLSSQLQLLVYYGNPSLTGSEVNPAGVWQGYLARWRLPDGTDATGSGRDLAAANVQPGELLGSAAHFDGSGQLTLAETTWLDGLSTLTVQALVKPDAAMLGANVRILGMGGATAAAGITLGYLAEAAAGVANVVYATVGSTDGEAATFSRADLQTTERQLIHARWQSSDAPHLYLNGGRATPSSSQARSGQTQSAGGPLEIGRDWAGLIDEIRVTGRSLPAAWIAVEARNMLTPELSYGLGQEETATTIVPPVVAVPFDVQVEAGKWVDVDVLSKIFAPAGRTATIIGVSQPANGSATVIGNAVRYVSASDFRGKDQFTYTISNGDTQSTGRIVIGIIDPASQGQGELPAGENLLSNSKFTGDVAGADNWLLSFPAEGAVLFEDRLDDHRQIRCISAGSDRATIEQSVTIEQGARYTFSVDCVAISDFTDDQRVVLNVVPDSAVTFITNRPVIGDMIPNTRFHFVFEALATREVKLRIGPAAQQGNGGADVVLQRPMLDKAGTLRAYAATDPVQTPPATEMNWEAVPNNGLYDGWIALCGHTNMTQRIRDGYFGWRMTMRRDGALIGIQHQVASNRNGETSKSRVNGSNSHGYPASWKLGLRVFAADANWQISGPALRDIQWTYTNPDGGSGGASTNNSRVLFEHEIDALGVSKGQRLLFLIYNRESNPENNHPSVNMTMNAGRPSLEQNPPKAVSLFWGDDPIHVRASSLGGTLAPGTNGELFGLGLRYEDGIVEGHVGFDSTGSAFTSYIGNQQRVRQRWSSPYWRMAAQVAIAAYRLPGKTPNAPLILRLSGPDISNIEASIPASAVQIFDPNAAPFTYEYTHQIFSLPNTVILSPNTVYTIDVISNSSDEMFVISANRHYSNGLANSKNSTGSFLTRDPIEPHRWSGTAQKSADGGKTWADVGWSGLGSDLPIALVTDRRMATTAGGLPD